jgi:hypothetical protein
MVQPATMATKNNSARMEAMRRLFQGDESLSPDCVCVRGKVKKIFLEKAPKTWRIAVKALNNRRIFRPVAQLMYALSRVKSA